LYFKENYYKWENIFWAFKLEISYKMSYRSRLKLI
jgi:hypothetical protein